MVMLCFLLCKTLLATPKNLLQELKGLVIRFSRRLAAPEAVTPEKGFSKGSNATLSDSSKGTGKKKRNPENTEPRALQTKGKGKGKGKSAGPTQVAVSAPHESEASSWVTVARNGRVKKKVRLLQKSNLSWPCRAVVVRQNSCGHFWQLGTILIACSFSTTSLKKKFRVSHGTSTWDYATAHDCSPSFFNWLRFVQRFALHCAKICSRNLAARPLLAISGLFGAGGAEWRRSSAMQQLTLCWMTLIIFLRFARAWFGNYSWLVVVGSMILCFILFERYSPLKVKENYQKSQEVCAPCWVKVWPHINMDAVLHQRCPKGQEEKGSWCSPPRTLWDGTNSPSGVDSKKSI